MHADRFKEVIPSPERDASFIVDRKFSVASDQQYNMRETIKAEMASTSEQNQQNIPLDAELPPLESYKDDSDEAGSTLFFRP